MRLSYKQQIINHRQNGGLMEDVHSSSFNEGSQNSAMTEPFGVMKEDLKKVKESLIRS
ncbi:hypothetical protein [Pontibacillus yanchengensis]|uniref:hypothetical protein n=1 Tax=Pontibacillus yanchengensis TaxID=462910 RepID=UPI001377C499|nr:hypothetical protein [Pontibacillus yanchengensis]